MLNKAKPVSKELVVQRVKPAKEQVTASQYNHIGTVIIIHPKQV